MTKTLVLLDLKSKWIIDCCCTGWLDLPRYLERFTLGIAVKTR